MKTSSILLLLLTIATFSCQKASDVAAEGNIPGTQQPYEAFFDALALHCGNAYQGGLTTAPPGDDMITFEDILVVHFRECDENVLKAPFHIQTVADGEWNRSRTWIFTKHQDGLELRHDHRKPDGSEDEVTMYGGFQYGENEAGVQIFQSVPRTEESGIFRGWRIEIEPNVRYTYGTVRGDEWSWRIDFDLTTPIVTPPAPWGHE
jgi:hypothetical protein